MEFVSCFILASVYSDILFVLQIPFTNTITDHVLTKLLGLIFQCPYATPASFACSVHYRGAPWPVEDVQGVDSLMPAVKEQLVSFNSFRT